MLSLTPSQSTIYCAQSPHAASAVWCPLYLQGGKEGLSVSILIYILIPGECVSSGKSNLEPAQDVGYRTHSTLPPTVAHCGATTQLTGALCFHSSSKTEVISSQAWQLDFPGDLYKPEVSWEVSQLHHPAFGVYSYSN